MRTFYIFYLLLFFSARAYSQTENAAASADSTKYSVFSIGTSYGNTANYYGQTTAEKLPYASADLSYSHKTGLWAAASAIKLMNTGSELSEVDLSAGYDFDISKKLGGSLSYTRYFFAKNSPLPQSINPNTASAGLLYDWKWLNSSLYGDYVFGNLEDENGNSLGNQSDFFLTFSNSKLIDLGSLFSEKDYVTIEPSIQLTGGTQRIGYYEEVSETQPGGSLLPGIGKGRRQVLFPTTNQDENRTYVESSKFSLLTSSFILPVAYNRNNYTLEARYQLSLPNKNFEGIDHNSQSYFTLSFSYFIFKN